MATSLVSTGITFPDATTQTTAAVGAASGVTNTTSAVSITLTSSSNKTQNVSMTAVDKAVILPDATTITRLGSDLFTINNTGAYHFYIQLSAGGYINQVAPGGSVTLSLSDNTTSDGKWVQSDLGYTAYKMYDYSSFLLPSSQIAGSTFFQGTTPKYLSIQNVTPLSATTFFISYLYSANSELFGVIGTLSGTTITYGTPVSFGTNGNTYSGSPGVLKFSSTTGILIAAINTGVTFHFIPFSVSGTTISVGTLTSLATTTQVIIPTDGQTLSSTLGAIYTLAGASAYLQAVRAVQYNGLSAPTLGTATTVLANSGRSAAAIAIVSSTTAAIVYAEYTPTNNVLARVVTFSGTSAPTLGTSLSLGTDVANTLSYSQAVTYFPLYINFISGTEFNVSSFSNYISWQKNITISGTTVSSPTSAAPIPQNYNPNIYLPGTQISLPNFSPKWRNATTGIAYTTSTNGKNSPQTNAQIKEAKFISGLGWLLGLNLPMPSAFYTPTGVNQAAGLSIMNDINLNVAVNVLDSSTMLVTLAISASTQYPANQSYTAYSVLIKPTT